MFCVISVLFYVFYRGFFFDFVFCFQSSSARITALEGKNTSQTSVVERLEAETATARADNSLLRTQMDVLAQNYNSVMVRIDQLETAAAARAQEDLVRAQTIDEQDKAIVSIKDRSNSLKKRIKVLEVRVLQGDGSDAVLSQLADLTRRLGDIESSAGRISGGQSTISSVARLKDQVTYLGRWVHALVEQVWDIQRYTRRRSLHVVSFFMSFFPFVFFHYLLFSPCSLFSF